MVKGFQLRQLLWPQHIESMFMLPRPRLGPRQAETQTTHFVMQLVGLHSSSESVANRPSHTRDMPVHASICVRSLHKTSRSPSRVRAANHEQELEWAEGTWPARFVTQLCLARTKTRVRHAAVFSSNFSSSSTMGDEIQHGF